MSTQNKKGDVMATQLVVREMLEMMDTMDRGFGVIKAETEEEEAIKAEYMAVYQSILDTFAKLGVTQVETLGKEFDYEVHQAVMQRPSEDYEEGIVCDELQKGFMIGDTLIRAAMVSVAA
jgi:molecular chaperone GrpE